MRNTKPSNQMLELNINDSVSLNVEKKGKELLINDQSIQYQIERLDENRIKIYLDQKIYEAKLISKEDNELHLFVNNQPYTVKINDHIDQILEELGMTSLSVAKVSDIKAPMPGTILSIAVKAGDTVEKGTPLLILEAMKMENVIKSPGDGTVRSISVTQGDNVEKNELLISFD